MNNNLLLNFPKEIKYKILSYLYFSDYKANYIQLVHYYLMNYKENIISKLRKVYQIDFIYYSILKYFLYDTNSIKKYNINYEPLHYHYSSKIKKKEIYRIFNKIRIVDALRIYKFIMFDGKSSEYYILF